MSAHICVYLVYKLVKYTDSLTDGSYSIFFLQCIETQDTVLVFLLLIGSILWHSFDWQASVDTPLIGSACFN